MSAVEGMGDCRYSLAREEAVARGAIKKTTSASQNQSIESRNLLAQKKRCITTSKISNNLEGSGQDAKGAYINWCPDGNERFCFIPMSEFKNIVTKLEHLDVTVKTQKAEALTLLNQFRNTESFSLTKVRRYPQKGDYCFGFRVTELCESLNKFNNDCCNVNYNDSKSVIFNKFMKIGNDDGWKEAYKYAMDCTLKPITSPQSYLDHYLWFLCCLVNIDKINSNYTNRRNSSFEKMYGLQWKEIQQ